MTQTLETPTLATLAEYTDYAGAQQAVDNLSDADFPVERLRIVGHDMKSIEMVTGRRTKGRAAGWGAATGAWFGLFAALLLGLFVPAPAWFAIVMTGLVVGALWGAAFGFFGHLATRGQRDFSSETVTVASRYEVQVDPQLLLRARQALRLV